MILFRAAEPQGFVGAFVTPENEREVDIERSPESLELHLSEPMVIRLGKRRVKELHEDERPFLAHRKFEFVVVLIDEAYQQLSVLLLESIAREVFGDKPRIPDRVVADQIHPVRVTPDVAVFELEVILACLASSGLIFVLPYLVERPGMGFDSVVDITSPSREPIEDDQRDDDENAHEPEELNEASQPLDLKCDRVQTVWVGGGALQQVTAFVRA